MRLNFALPLFGVLFICEVVSCLIPSVTRLQPCRAVSNKRTLKLSVSLDDEDIDYAARAKIEEVIANNNIVLFMKGNKLFPSCGFSNTAVQILNSLKVNYHTVDVGADERIRMELKRYSEWPTIPQLYLQGEFLGGSDIMLEMYQAGELQERIEIAAAS